MAKAFLAVSALFSALQVIHELERGQLRLRGSHCVVGPLLLLINEQLLRASAGGFSRSGFLRQKLALHTEDALAPNLILSPLLFLFEKSTGILFAHLKVFLSLFVSFN